MIDDLDENIYRRIEKSGIKKTFGENEQIFGEGETANFLPIVCSGQVKMVRFPEPGKELILGFFTEGEVFAIAPALDGKTFPATAIAAKKTQLLLVPRPAFLGLMKESSEFAAFLTSRMCGLLRDRTSSVQILAMSSADRRVANVVLKMAEGCNAKCPIKIPFRRQEIAEMSGLTLETAIRSVRKLEKRSYLKIVNRKIFLENFEPLRKLVGQG